MIVIISILALVLVTLISALTFLAYRYLKLKESQLAPVIVESKILPNLQDQISGYKKIEPASSYCIDHPENKAKGICSISSEAFCELCLTKQDDLRLGRKYLDFYLDTEWIKLLMVEDEQLDLENLEQLKAIKNEGWISEKRPLIIQDQFKINIEEDKIESYKVLLTRQEDKITYLEKLSFLN